MLHHQDTWLRVPVSRGRRQQQNEMYGLLLFGYKGRTCARGSSCFSNHTTEFVTSHERWFSKSIEGFMTTYVSFCIYFQSWKAALKRLWGPLPTFLEANFRHRHYFRPRLDHHCPSLRLSFSFRLQRIWSLSAVRTFKWNRLKRLEILIGWFSSWELFVLLMG